MLRQTFIAALSLVLCATAVRAEEVPMALRASSGPIGTSVARVRFDPRDQAQFAGPRHPRLNRTAQKVAAGIAVGVAGMFAGAMIGAALDRNCGCADPGLRGSIIGAWVGGIAGGVAGVVLTSR